jgi:hypothetical protein
VLLSTGLLTSVLRNFPFKCKFRHGISRSVDYRLGYAYPRGYAKYLTGYVKQKENCDGD